MLSPLPPATISELQNLVHTHPLIDHHAHNLLRSTHSAAYPLEAITSEASGIALSDASKTLSHVRAVRQLSTWLGCAPTWESIKEKRGAIDQQAWAKKCLWGTQCLLIDDGLDERAVEPYHWHDQFTQSPTKRIVRIEKLAEQTLREFAPDFNEDGPLTSDEGNAGDYEADTELFNRWSERFAGLINAATKDPRVAGFKSIVCYRGGLDVVGNTTGGLLLEAVKNALRLSKKEGASYKIRDKILGDFLVCEVARLIAKSGSWKPLQFHTGLGDNDIDLRKSNPAYLQNFIKENPDVPVVLLHSSYPFTREAGYLATMYKNVYLDIGLAFPVLSKDGQESVVKQCLELVPSNKLLWSTDGHWFPETFALANMQMREVLSEVLTKHVTEGQLTVLQAAELTKNLLFGNSNELYKLNLTPVFTPPAISPINSIPIAPMTQDFTSFLQRHSYIKYVRLQWVDYTNTLRLRIVPVTQMRKMVEKGSLLTVTRAVLSMLQTDQPAEDFSPAGRYNLLPDWSSLRICPGSSAPTEEKPQYASVMCYFRDETEEADICPRTVLSRALRTVKKQHGIDVLVGFETEVTFLDKVHLTPISSAHGWSTSRSLQNRCLKVLEQIVDALEQSGIEVLLFHPESATSQYEIVTGPLPALESVDALYHIRETIWRICGHHDIRATLHPKPFQDLAGTAAHMHMSISPPTESFEESFFAGILSHLGSIAALTMPMSASYARLKDSCWAGGTWIAWGEENREVPLRRVSKADAHWELRCLDGLANAYLALAGVIAAGSIGITDGVKLPGKSCDGDPSKMTSRERNNLGITKQLPDSIAKALENLKKDKKLRERIGEAAMTKYAIMKKGEMAALESVAPLKDWIIERY